MSLYFVRHGQTDWNAQRKLQGKSDISLNEVGKQQAETTAAAMQELTIQKIYCSPLLRAKETAAILNTQWNCEVCYEPRLAERSFGELEGAILKDGCYLWDFSCPDLDADAEDLYAFFQRVQSFLKEIAQEAEQDDILIVAHGGVYLPCHEFYMGLDREADLMKVLPANCSITQLSQSCVCKEHG